MKTSTVILLCTSVLTLSACGMTEGAKQKDAKVMSELSEVEKDENYICKTVSRIGSNFKKRRCITKEAHEREQKSAKKALEEVDRNWSNHTGG